MCEKFRPAGASALNQSVVDYRRKQQEKAFNAEAADAILPRYMRQTIVSLQKAWIDRRISSKTLRLTTKTTTDENNCSSSAENDKRRSYLDWNGNYTTNDLNSKSSNLTLRNTFPLHKKKFSTSVLEATTNGCQSPANPRVEAPFSSLSDDREQRNVRLVLQSDATTDDVHPSATLQSSLSGPGNRRQLKTAEPKQLTRGDSNCSYRRSCVDSHSSADLPSLFGVRLVSGRRTLPLQEKRQKMQSIGAEQLPDSSGICSEPKKVKTPSPRVYSREVLEKCRQPRQGISNPNDAGIICISREAKLSSDKTDASQPVRASSRWSREDARNNAKTARLLLHSAQTSRCPSSSDRPRSVLQRPTTSLARGAPQPRKLCTLQSARRQQTVIRRVFQGFVDYDGRKENRTNNEAPPSSCRKPNFRTTDNGAFDDLVPSTVSSEDEADDDYDDFRSKSRLDAINHYDYSTTFRRHCEETSKKGRGKRVGLRGRIVEWDEANGFSIIPNGKSSSSRNPSTRNKELDAAAAAKLQAKDTAVRAGAREEEGGALGDGPRYAAAGHGADDNGDRVVLRQTILERMLEAADADDSDAKTERIVAWLLGLGYDQRERLPSPDILDEMSTQTDTAIHIVYDGD